MIHIDFFLIWINNLANKAIFACKQLMDFFESCICAYVFILYYFDNNIWFSFCQKCFFYTIILKSFKPVLCGDT